MIIDNCPDQSKLPFALWTRESVGNLLRGKFNVDVSIWAIGRYLRSWGFTPQKPIYKAYEQKSPEVKKSLINLILQLKQELLKKDLKFIGVMKWE